LVPHGKKKPEKGGGEIYQLKGGPIPRLGGPIFKGPRGAKKK